ELIDVRGRVSLLLLERCLQSPEGSADFVNSVAIFLYEIIHHSHAFVETALHGSHLLLQLLDLGLQLDHFFVDAPGGSSAEAKCGKQGENNGAASECHRRV